MNRDPRDPAWAPATDVAQARASGPVHGGGPAGRFRSAAERARRVRRALLVTMGLAAALAAVYLVRYVFLDRPGDLPDGLFAGLGDLSGILLLATAGLGLISLALWMAWSSRVESNAPTLGAGEGTIGPAGAILWWFVPVANLFIPFGLILGLGRRLSDDAHRAWDGVVVVWWLTLLGSGVAVVATWIELQAALGEAAVRAALLHAAVAQLAWLLAAALSLSVVRLIQHREDARAARMGDAASSGPSVVAPVPMPVGAIAGLPGAVRVPVSATPGSAPVGVVDGVTRPSAGSPPEGGSRAERRGSVGMFLAVAAFFIVGFILVPWLLSSSPGAGTTVPSADARPSLVAVASGTALPSFTAGPLPTPGASTNPGPTFTPVAPVSPPPLVSPPPQVSPGPSASGIPAGSPATGSPAPGTAQPSPSPAVQPPTPPVAATAVAYLLDHVSAGDGTCAASPIASVPPGALAAITCLPGAAAVADLQYAVFPTSDAATLTYDAAVRASGVVPGSGACLAGQPGETSFLTDNQPAGRILCFVDQAGGSAVPRLVWVDDRLAIIGLARGTGTTLPGLFDWWKTQSGPI